MIMSNTGFPMIGFKGNGAAPADFVRQLSGEVAPRGLIGRMRLALSVRRERIALRSLDDAALKDIGLSRFDVERECTRGLLDLPSQNPADRRYRV
jgi:uncharacterized protein YjiS (DUF1127 family)